MILRSTRALCHLPADLLHGGIGGTRALKFPLPLRMKQTPGTVEEQDEDLVRRIALGDRIAFGEFYDRHHQTLFAVALRILANPASAEDVLQDVFIQVWERASQYDRGLGRPLGWAVVMTRNKAIDRLRARQRRSRLSERAAQESVEPDVFTSSPGDEDRGEHLRNALTILPSDQRSAIELAFFEGLSQTEIAERMHEPLGTIKARIRRGMLRLRDKLKGVL